MSLIKSGISIRQGPHQVPQKLSNITFPFKSSKLTKSPFKFAKVKFGAKIRLSSPLSLFLFSTINDFLFELLESN